MPAEASGCRDSVPSAVRWNSRGREVCRPCAAVATVVEKKDSARCCGTVLRRVMGGWVSLVTRCPKLGTRSIESKTGRVKDCQGKEPAGKRSLLRSLPKSQLPGGRIGSGPRPPDNPPDRFPISPKRGGFDDNSPCRLWAICENPARDGRRNPSGLKAGSFRGHSGSLAWASWERSTASHIAASGHGRPG